MSTNGSVKQITFSNYVGDPLPHPLPHEAWIKKTLYFRRTVLIQTKSKCHVFLQNWSGKVPRPATPTHNPELVVVDFLEVIPLFKAFPNLVIE